MSILDFPELSVVFSRTLGLPTAAAVSLPGAPRFQVSAWLFVRTGDNQQCHLQFWDLLSQVMELPGMDGEATDGRCSRSIQIPYE